MSSAEDVAPGPDGDLPAEIARHAPILRRRLDAGQTVLLLTRCARYDTPHRLDHLMLLTRERLVVTGESARLHRARPHLDTGVTELSHARWEPDPAGTAIEFTATAADGVRERFLIPCDGPESLWHLDATFGYVFRPSGVRRFNPVRGRMIPIPAARVPSVTIGNRLPRRI